MVSVSFHIQLRKQMNPESENGHSFPIAFVFRKVILIKLRTVFNASDVAIGCMIYLQEMGVGEVKKKLSFQSIIFYLRMAFSCSFCRNH